MAPADQASRYNPTVQSDHPRSLGTLFNRISMVLAFAGLFVAGNLSVAHVLDVALPCGEGGGCAAVTSSPASQLLGIPVAYLGVFAYIALAVLSGIRATASASGFRSASVAGLAISGAGVLASGYLQYYSFFVLSAVCYWCLASAIIMLLLFLAHVVLVRTAPSESNTSAEKDFILMVGSAVVVTGALIAMATVLKPAPPKVFFGDPNKLSQLTEEQLVPPNANIKGNKDAPVTIVEWGDLLCSYCRRYYPEINQIVANSNGSIRLVFRHLPLYQMEEHRAALPAAIYAEIAAEQGKVWQFIEGMFSFTDTPNYDMVLSVATQTGLDAAMLQKRQGDPNDPALMRVQRDIAAAKSFVKQLSTPTFVVYVRGKPNRWQAGTMDDLKTILARDEVSEAIAGSGAKK